MRNTMFYTELAAIDLLEVSSMHLIEGNKSIFIPGSWEVHMRNGSSFYLRPEVAEKFLSQLKKIRKAAIAGE